MYPSRVARNRVIALIIIIATVIVFIHKRSSDSTTSYLQFRESFKQLLAIINSNKKLTKQLRQPGPDPVTGQCRLYPLWTERPLGMLADRIARAQRNCTPVPQQVFGMNQWGMGSDIHTWSQQLCYALERESALYLTTANWIWNDASICSPDVNAKGPLNCYFGIHNLCPRRPESSSNGRHHDGHCRLVMSVKDEQFRQPGSTLLRVTDFRRASLEYLFANVSRKVLDLTEQAATAVFGKECFPEEMITVHVRWGDKHKEMKLVGLDVYLKAINDTVHKYNIQNPTIFLTTEDPKAYNMMQSAISNNPAWLHWRLLVFKDAMFSDSSNSPMAHAGRSKGAAGLHSLQSLLMSLHARHYVLTLCSNWSRVIDELRASVIDPYCRNCTTVIDTNSPLLCEW